MTDNYSHHPGFLKTSVLVRHVLVLLLGLCVPSVLQAQVVAPQINLETVVSGFNDPVDIDHAGDDRLFITERQGRIWITDTSGNTLATPFLDIDARVGSSGQEQGLLGLAFPEDYGSTGWFYVNYTDNSGTSTISRFSVSADPNVADPASEQVKLSVPQPFSNHNGGCLAFGPDEKLYIGLGDGGLFDDPGNRSQDPMSLLGKMLRIELNAGGYTIPPDNPYRLSSDTLEEIWHMGLRNPWRFSFDRETGDLWIGDVGQGEWEEIDFQIAGSPGGENWGWRCLEGPDAYITGGCGPLSAYDDPLFAYDHSTGGLSVTGGYVYRGENQFTLSGTDPDNDFAHYLLADYVTGRWWSIQHQGCLDDFVVHPLGIIASDISAFGEDASGELFCANLSTGVISRVVDQCSQVHPDQVLLDYDAGPDTLRLEGMPEGTYIWFNAGVSTCDTIGMSDRFGLGAGAPFNGLYTTEVEYPDGCKIRYTNAGVWSGLEALDAAADWAIAPQPAVQYVNWSVPADNPAAVLSGTAQVLDATGRILETLRLDPQAQGFTHNFRTADWPVGLYVLRWQADAPDGSGVRREASRTVLIQR